MAVGGGTDWLSLGASVGGAILGFMGNKSSAKAQTKAQEKALKKRWPSASGAESRPWMRSRPISIAAARMCSSKTG
jgi:hypothetical protein